MKKTIVVFVIVINSIFFSCTDKCIENNSPLPASFFVELIDETTSENVFTNQTFAATDIAVKDILDNDIVFKFVEGGNIIQLLPRTTINANNIEIKIILNNQTTMVTKEVVINYNVTSLKEECYTSFSFTNILFSTNDSTMDEKGVFIVKI